MLTQYRPNGRNASEIAADVEAAVRDGRLRPGASLPPVRVLATELRLSPATVAAAYRDLRVKGIARGHRRAGTQVTGTPPVAPRPPVAVPPGARNLISGSPDPDLLPRLPKLGRAAAVASVAAASASPRLYGDPPISPRLAELAATRFRADGIDAANISVVSGALDGVERIAGAWLHPGDRIAVEDPGYPPLLDLCVAMDLDMVPLSQDALGVRPESLEQALHGGCQAVVLVPRAQSPTGAAWDANRAADLRAVLETALSTLVIEDDHAADVAGSPAFSAASGLARWAVIRSVSKSLGPDFRLAVVAADAITAARLEGRQALGPGWVSYLLQDTVAELWADPVTADVLNQATAIYAQRREQLVSDLATLGIAACGQSGMALWVPVADEISVTSALLEQGWAVAPGERFRIASQPGIRIGIATLTTTESAQLAAELAACLRRRPRRTD
jgi:DNA-binding transcriptional MocR family regulator